MAFKMKRKGFPMHSTESALKQIIDKPVVTDESVVTDKPVIEEKPQLPQLGPGETRHEGPWYTNPNLSEGEKKELGWKRDMDGNWYYPDRDE